MPVKSLVTAVSKAIAKSLISVVAAVASSAFLSDNFDSYSDPTAVPSVELKVGWKVTDEAVGCTITGGKLQALFDVSNANFAIHSDDGFVDDGDFILQHKYKRTGSVSEARQPINIGFRRSDNTATLKAGADDHYELQGTTSFDLEKRSDAGAGQLVSNVDLGIEFGEEKTIKIFVTNVGADVRIIVTVDDVEKINVLDNGTVAGAQLQAPGTVSLIFGGLTAGNGGSIDDFDWAAPT